MQKTSRISMRDIEQETERFLKPMTDKEKAIIDAAVAVMSERGVDGATTAEIARRAQTTERTLFRYFPSKQDLINRILFPLLMRAGLSRGWEAFAKRLKVNDRDFRSWYIALTADRFANITGNPGLSRIVLVEVLQNESFRAALAKLWRQHIWVPMVEGVKELQAKGAVRPDIDPQVLARAIHCLHVGYFLARYVFAPGRSWNDAAEIEKMAEILATGSAGEPRKRRGGGAQRQSR